MAANLDNPQSAYARIVKHMPVASITDNNIGILHKLHPPSLNLPIDTPRRPMRQSAKSKRQQKGHFTFSPKEIIKILSRLSCGKASGPEIDSLDVFIKLAGLHKRSAPRRASIAALTNKSLFNSLPSLQTAKSLLTFAKCYKPPPSR